jgi:putative phage-type endonuclease
MSAPLIPTEAMEWGNRLESAILVKYGEEQRCKVRKDKRVKRHPQYPWMLAHIDGWVDPGGIVDAKSAGLWSVNEWGEQGTDQVPDDYRLQAVHYMSVTDREFCDFALLVAGQKFRLYRVVRDQEIEDALIEAERAFWHDHVLAKVPPPVDGSEASRTLLEVRFPKAVVESIDPPDGFEELALSYLSAKATVKALTGELDVLANLMREKLGDADATSGPQYRARWSNVKSPARTDWAGVVRDAAVPPEIVERNTKAGGETRRFEVRPLEDVS